MLNVLVLVDHAVGISGPHRNVVGSLNALAQQPGVQIHLVTGRIDPLEPYARSPRVRIHLGFQPKEPGRAAHNVRLVRSVARECTVVYVPTNLTSFLYAQTVRHGRRVVVGPNVTALSLPLRRLHDAPGRIELLGMCDLWMEASEARRQHVIRQSGIGRVTCIRHAIDTAKFSPAHRDPALWARFRVPDADVRIVCVGRDNEARKRIPQLLEAARLLERSTSSTRVQFILVGAMSAETDAAARAIPNVHLLGFQGPQELPVIMASGDIAFVPSSWESVGFVVLEALASGLPIVASRVGGIPEQFVDGECGILVEATGPDGLHRPDAPQRFAAALTRLVTDPALRSQMGEAARQHALVAFSEARLGHELRAALGGAGESQ